MTCSRYTTRARHPLKRRHAQGSVRRLPLASAISAILMGVPVAHAADTETTSGATLDEVVVPAQKRTENLQDVPISIEVLDNAKLEQLHVVGLDDYVKYSPSIAY